MDLCQLVEDLNDPCSCLIICNLYFWIANSLTFMPHHFLFPYTHTQLGILTFYSDKIIDKLSYDGLLKKYPQLRIYCSEVGLLKNLLFLKSELSHISYKQFKLIYFLVYFNFYIFLLFQLYYDLGIFYFYQEAYTQAYTMFKHTSDLILQVST